MKNLALKNCLFVPAAIALALAINCWPQNTGAQTPPAPDISAPATPVAPPPNIVPGSPFAEVVRLTQAGVDQSVIATYVTNATSLFNLDADRIIYLTNLGATSSVVTAMMQRDQQLQQQFSASQAAQQAQQQPAQPAPVPQAAPTDTADAAPSPSPDQPVTTDYFNDTLSPYGSWVVVSGYGRCWRPAAVIYDSSWQPYCDHGRWVYTDCGWYWNSDYAWGATFHYGRWFRDAGLGWCWYPDTVWAPSWVTWRYSDNYCGWAPLPPRTSFRAGVGIVYNGGGVSVGFNFGLDANCFTFVPTRRFCDPHPRDYCAAPAQVTQIYNNTTVVNNYNVHDRAIVNHGVPVENIAVATRTAISPVPVRQFNPVVVHSAHDRSPSWDNHDSGANHMAYTRDFSSPLRTPVPPQNYSPQPPQSHNNTVVIVPQHPAPANYYHFQPQAAPVQTAPANRYNINNNTSLQPAPRQWQPTETPHNATHNYEPHENSYHPTAPPMPQPAVPAHAPAPSKQPPPGGSQPGGKSNGNPNSQSH